MSDLAERSLFQYGLLCLVTVLVEQLSAVAFLMIIAIHAQRSAILSSYATVSTCSSDSAISMSLVQPSLYKDISGNH